MMNDARSTAAEATSTSEGENRGRNQHRGSFGTLGASRAHVLGRTSQHRFNVALRHVCLEEMCPSPSSITSYCPFYEEPKHRLWTRATGPAQKHLEPTRPEITGAKKRLHSTARPSQQQEICWKPHTYCSHSFPTWCPTRAGGEYCLLKCTGI